MHLRERITSSRERKNCTRQYTQKTLAKVQRPQAGDPDLPRQTQPKEAGLREGEILQELRKAPTTDPIWTMPRISQMQSLSEASPRLNFRCRPHHTGQRVIAQAARTPLPVTREKHTGRQLADA